MRRLADLIRDNADRIGAIESRDTGKPLGQATGEVVLGADFLTYFAGHAELPNGRTHPADAGYFVYSVREPYGVVGRDQPVELPVPAGLLEDGAGPRRRATPSCSRWPSRPRMSTTRARPPDDRSRHARRRVQRRPRRRPDDRRRPCRAPARPQADLHRVDRDRPGDPAIRGRPHQERPPRARWQDPEHRLRGCGHGAGDLRLAVHRLLQHRARSARAARACWSSARTPTG